MTKMTVVNTPEQMAMSKPCTWTQLNEEAARTAVQERAMASMLHDLILGQKSFQSALANHLAEKLANAEFKAIHIRETIADAYNADPSMIKSASADLLAVRQRDPAATSCLQVFLYFKGFLALQTYRITHYLFTQGRDMFAYHLQSRCSELFGVDIHPAAKIGHGIMLDHATGIVIGETAVVGDGCSLLHGVTLGGTGKEHQDRHPKVGEGVLIGAGAKILGNITIGDHARIAAGSVVLSAVSSHCTVAGVPAKPIGGPCKNPAQNMNQNILKDDT
ncbi:serine O-acetyltransferase [Robiginitomaculum antarcticum]|uniref:serine O-acetyltransferase n=1 Tax=Robiginitomaculum antarcticum TaxID=437507 RepID=UPI00035D6A9A|nr:serine O-acetyltransferase [Robiginitomaculum antarcticum]